MAAKPMIYRCNGSRFWHLGSNPAAVLSFYGRIVVPAREAKVWVSQEKVTRQDVLDVVEEERRLMVDLLVFYVEAGWRKLHGKRNRSGS